MEDIHSEMWCWAFLFYFKGTTSWIPLKPKLLVMCERIGETLEKVYGVLCTF
jgi:hypothetical protein